MINILSSSVIPCILFSAENTFIKEFKGALFEVNSDDFSYLSDKAYYDEAKVGWNISSNGYATYTVLTEDYKIVFTGMKVKGISSTRGKEKGIPLFINEKIVIENYIISLFNVCHSYTVQRTETLQNYTHELKKIVSDIYHKTVTIKTNANLSDFHKEIAESICALTDVLSTKSDIMNFLSNPDFSQCLPEDNIGVHKKFLKMVKCFKDVAKKKEVEINMDGNSFKSIPYGPDGFEIIPYLLIENAVKYSPEQFDISISFEDMLDGVSVKVASIGPEITEEDSDKIFSKGYRGKSAQQVTTTGRGLGLFLAKEFLEKGFRGRISVSQEAKEIVHLNNISYRKTIFKLFIPC